jgi:hypothetical protein
VARRPRAPIARNPYKGLRPFTEADEADFFGRDELVRSMLEVLGDRDRPLLAVVGPSGSGKSSAVHAGLVPALRADGVPGLGPVATIVTLVPGSDPFGALTAALAAATASGTAVPPLASERWLSDLLDRVHEAGAVVVVIDQFEELFTLVADHTVQRRFLDASTGRSTSTPIASGSSWRCAPTCSTGRWRTPPSAAGSWPGPSRCSRCPPSSSRRPRRRPAERAGLTVEPALLAALIADLADQPGALPLFQYALTELFERRGGGATLTLGAYRAFGGIDGAVSRRAEEVYARLTPDEQAVARQLFLRLVHPGEHAADSRRRVPASELAALDVDAIATHTVLDRFGRARLLSFDRDPRTGGPTIELAHDALLQAWGRLRTWVDEARDDLRRRIAGHGRRRVARRRRGPRRPPDRRPTRPLRGVGRSDLARAHRGRAALPRRLRRPPRPGADRPRTPGGRPRPGCVAGHGDGSGRTRRQPRRAGGRRDRRCGRPARGDRRRTSRCSRLGGDGGFEQFMQEGIDRVGRNLDVATEVVIAQADPTADIRGLCAGGADLVFVGGFPLFGDARGRPRLPGDDPCAARRQRSRGAAGL